jgi:hypothetical protein
MSWQKKWNQQRATQRREMITIRRAKKTARNNLTQKGVRVRAEALQHHLWWCDDCITRDMDACDEKGLHVSDRHGVQQWGILEVVTRLWC